MRRPVVLVAVLSVTGCGGGEDDGEGDGGGLDGSTAGGPGDPCIYTSDCMPDLYCSEFRVCSTAGAGADGDTCARTADCMRGLTCVTEPEGMVCRTAGTRRIGEPCLRHEQCAAGLFCYMSECTGGVPDAGTGGFDGGRTVCTPGGGDCDDDSPCTTDQCVADTCVHTLVDSDMDGYASTVLGSCGLDCADMDEGANPDQEAWFAERHEGGPGQAQTFDWNCDGVEEKRYPDAILCTEPACASSEGWLDDVPDCGATGRWGRCTGSGRGCSEEVLEESRQQTCR